MPHSYDAIVIGSGLGGLTAGAMFARTGAKVLLLERNSAFGGAATTYRHGGLTIEASLHETSTPHVPGDPKRHILEALDIADQIEFVPIENFHEIRCPLVGEPFVLPHGLDRIEEKLMERFPHHKRGIQGFLRQVHRTHRALDYLRGGHSAGWHLAHAGELPLDLWAVLRDIKSSLSRVMARHFGADEAIKFVLAGNLPYYADDPDTYWWFHFAIAQGGYLQQGGSYIKGGSQTLSDLLANVIREEGGQTLSGCEAVAIGLNSGGQVESVDYRSADDGSEVTAHAPVIFANAAPHVVEGLLPAEQRDVFMTPFKERPISISLLSLTLGLSRPPSDLGLTSYSTQLIPTWMKRFNDYKQSAGLFRTLPEDRMPAMGVVDYNRIDSGLRGGPLFPLSVVCADRLENWDGLSDDDYQKKKDAWTDAIIDRLNSEWPGLADAVSEKTLATARTMRHYLNTPGGAVYGFAPRPPEQMPKGVPMTVETPIDRLYLASSYAGFGGFNGAMICGAAAARAACGQITA